MYENAMTGRRVEITSFQDLAKIVEGWTWAGTVAVFYYRCGSCSGDVILPEDEVLHQAFCDEVGAQRENHQLIVRYSGNSWSRSPWVFYWFHDNNVYLTNDHRKIRIFERNQRG